MARKAKRINKNKTSNLTRLIKTVAYIAAVIYVCQALISQEITMRQTKAKIAEYQEIIQKQEIKRDELAVTLEKLNTPEYMEKLARSKLGMIKADEIVFVDITTKR